VTNQIVSNLTKYKQIITKGQKTEIELSIIFHNFSIEQNLNGTFANKSFRFGSIGSEFIKKMMMKMINYSLKFEKLIINEALFDQSYNEYLW
jgi:hypothetical protein